MIPFLGPKAVSVIQKLVEDKNTASDSLFSSFPFMSARSLRLKGGIDVYISRCGYTGEDGFEISLPHSKVTQLCTELLANPAVKLAGLGARDSLRLEAGLCLYGHDISDDTTPVQAGLTWTIGKRRRVEGEFPGSDIILAETKKGGFPVDAKRRVGLVVLGSGAPAREHAEIYESASSMSSKLIGAVTSGCPSPSLKKNIAMGYVTTGFHKAGTRVGVKVRNKMYEAEITKMPFVAHNYYRGA